MNKNFFFFLVFSFTAAAWAQDADEIFNRVTRDYGALKVRAGTYTANSTIVPWSSWWFPAREDFLFAPYRHNVTGVIEDSPLQRYDEAVWAFSRRRENPRSVDFESDQQNGLYSPVGEGWAGLCDAWALASIMEPEPKNGLRYAGLTFRIGDLKALIIKTYDGVSGLKQYGQRFYGKKNVQDEGVEPRLYDIFPDQFHRFLQVELFQKRLPFLMDYDPGEQVWTVPVYKAETVITKDEQNLDRVHVRTVVFHADSQSMTKERFNEVGTVQMTKRYMYTLYGEWRGEEFWVKSGEWTYDKDPQDPRKVKRPFGIDSRVDHPDYLIPRPDPKTFQRNSLNPRLNLDYVDVITQRAERMKQWNE